MCYFAIRFHDFRVEMTFDHCSAILRLGKKYDIKHLLNEGLGRFRHEFPSSLSGWDGYNQGEDLALEILGEEGLRAMSLAHELSINRCLPGIYLTYIRSTDMVRSFL